jgi:hypothetical protein
VGLKVGKGVGSGEGTPQDDPKLLPSVMLNFVPPLIADTSGGISPHSSFENSLKSLFEVATTVIKPNHDGIRPVRLLVLALNFFIFVK